MQWILIGSMIVNIHGQQVDLAKLEYSQVCELEDQASACYQVKIDGNSYQVCKNTEQEYFKYCSEFEKIKWIKECKLYKTHTGITYMKDGVIHKKEFAVNGKPQFGCVHKLVADN